MDCCICCPAAYRPPRNTVCRGCYDGAKGLLALVQELGGGGDGGNSWAPKGISGAVARVRELREEMGERLRFLQGLGSLWKQEAALHADILVRAAAGPPLPAHRALLASKSEVFKNMLSADNCKAPAGEAIALPELSHAELAALLHFLYHGDMPRVGADEVQQLLFSLMLAADKYDIPYLKKQCGLRIAGALAPSNALAALELADACADAGLRERAMATVVENARHVVFSPSYDEFARRNAHLCVEITRELLRRTAEADDAGGRFINS